MMDLRQFFIILSFINLVTCNSIYSLAHLVSFGCSQCGALKYIFMCLQQQWRHVIRLLHFISQFYMTFANTFLLRFFYYQTLF